MAESLATTIHGAHEQPLVETDTDSETAKAPLWHVMVYNDPVNLMNYVVMVFRRIFGYSLEKATKHMMEVHERGKSLLWSGDRETAELYVEQLHQWQLNAKLESDS